jgi:hypothetical protein
MAAGQDKELRMTNDRSTMPPLWAESLLRMMLKPGDRESISGDLLEEYRQAIVPALGSRANRWYVRQVGWYVLRATWPWAALAGGILITRYLFDTLAPVQYTRGVPHPRSTIMSWALIATFAVSGCWHAWRTRRLGGGVIAAFCATAMGGALSIVGTILCLAIWHDPQTWRAIQGSGGIEEALYGVPLMLVPIGTMVGTVGATVGRTAAAVYGASRPNTTSP